MDNNNFREIAESKGGQDRLKFYHLTGTSSCDLEFTRERRRTYKIARWEDVQDSKRIKNEKNGNTRRYANVDVNKRTI